MIHPSTGWWRRRSLRARLLAIGLLGLAIAQAVGSVALYVGLSVAGRQALDRSAAETAAQVVQLVQAHRLPDPIPVTGSESVQVVDRSGRVVSASASGDRLTPLLTAAEMKQAASGPVTVSGSRLGMASSLRVTATPTRPDGSGPVVLVAEPVGDLRRSQHQLVTTLLLVYPLLLALLGLIAWRVIGATLRPVESLRAAADRVSGAGDDERLPEPESRDEVRALAVTLNSMLDRLAAARDRERSFVSNVAHELRSPLASLRVQLDVSRRHGDDAETHEDLAAEVDRLSELVEDLLVLARLDVGDEPPAPQPPAEPVGVLARVAARHPGETPLLTVTTVGEGTVAMSDLELERVVANLVDNAVRHARSRVELSYDESPGGAVVRVEDDGPGIPAADRDRAFGRFTRLDEARDRDRGGTGLGLAIVRELVLRRGGEVRLGESSYGGLSVEVRFPA
jgi:signal transduction histidine kinase